MKVKGYSIVLSVLAIGTISLYLAKQDFSHQGPSVKPALPTKPSVSVVEAKNDANQQITQNIKQDGLSESESINIIALANRIKNRNPNLEFSEEELQASLNREFAWEFVRTAETVEEENYNPDKHMFELDTLKIESLFVGDELKISLPNIREDQVLSVRNVEMINGGTQWSGTVNNQDEQWFSITKGRVMTMGTLVSEYGQFEFRAVNEEGWVIASSKFAHFHEDDAVILKNQN